MEFVAENNYEGKEKRKSGGKLKATPFIGGKCTAGRRLLRDWSEDRRFLYETCK